MAATTKLKMTYEKEDGKTTSKTYNNISPQSTNENLKLTANKVGEMQKYDIKTVERIDSTIISG